VLTMQSGPWLKAVADPRTPASEKRKRARGEDLDLEQEALGRCDGLRGCALHGLHDLRDVPLGVNAGPVSPACLGLSSASVLRCAMKALRKMTGVTLGPRVQGKRGAASFPAASEPCPKAPKHRPPQPAEATRLLEVIVLPTPRCDLYGRRRTYESMANTKMLRLFMNSSFCQRHGATFLAVGERMSPWQMSECAAHCVIVDLGKRSMRRRYAANGSLHGMLKRRRYAAERKLT
jgi:hypothetical protein